VFSVGANTRLYKEDPRSAEIELRETLETEVKDDSEENATNSVEIWKSACEEKTLRVIITVRKSVTTIRLVKTEKSIVCV
jgi:hypothetical protein